MEKMVCTSADFAADLEKAINDGGCVPLVVTGNSMTPFLKDGKDIVWLCACKESDYKRGKILLFRRKDGSLVLHRVKKALESGELIMNGDAQSWCEKINKSQVVAVVSEIEHNGHKRASSAKTVWRLLMPVRPVLMRVWRKAQSVKK